MPPNARRWARHRPTADNISSTLHTSGTEGSAQLDLFVSAGSRLSDPDTSAAADTMAPGYRASIKAQVLAHLQAKGCVGGTADEIWQLMPDVLQSTLSRRVSDLADDGKIIDSGRRRPTRRSAPAVVWVAVDCPQVGHDAGDAA